MGTGAQWPGAFPGAGEEDVSELLIVGTAEEPSEAGAIRHRTGVGLRFNAEGMNLVISGWLGTGRPKVTRSAGKVTNVIVYTDGTETKKYQELVITRSAGKVSTLELYQHNSAGTQKYKITATLVRDSGKFSYFDLSEAFL